MKKIVLEFKIKDNYGVEYTSREYELNVADFNSAISIEMVLENADMDAEKSCSCFNEGQNHCECDPEFDEGEIIDFKIVRME